MDINEWISAGNQNAFRYEESVQISFFIFLSIKHAADSEILHLSFYLRRAVQKKNNIKMWLVEKFM